MTAMNNISYRNGQICVTDDTETYVITVEAAYKQVKDEIDMGLSLFKKMLEKNLNTGESTSGAIFEDGALYIKNEYVAFSIKFSKRQFNLSRAEINSAIDDIKDNNARNAIRYMLYEQKNSVAEEINITAELIDFVVPSAASIQEFVEMTEEEREYSDSAEIKILQKMPPSYKPYINKLKIPIHKKLKKYDVLFTKDYHIFYYTKVFRNVYIEKGKNYIELNGHIYCKKNITDNLTQKLKICRFNGDIMASDWYFIEMLHVYKDLRIDNNNNTINIKLYMVCRFETDGEHLILNIDDILGSTYYNMNVSLNTINKLNESAYEIYKHSEERKKSGLGSAVRQDISSKLTQYNGLYHSISGLQNSLTQNTYTRCIELRSDLINFDLRGIRLRPVEDVPDAA